MEDGAAEEEVKPKLEKDEEAEDVKPKVDKTEDSDDEPVRNGRGIQASPFDEQSLMHMK
jgi:hypothetical protein